MGTERPPQRKGHLELVRGLSDSRLFMHLLMNFLHRTDRDRRTVYEGDLDLASIGETVGLAAIEPVSRKPEFREKFSDFMTVIGLEGQRPISAMTIAEATGIPRETVRRKLKLLLERGVIVEKARGAYVIKPGFVQDPKIMEMIDHAMRDTLQLMNDCVKLGVMRWVDEDE